LTYWHLLFPFWIYGRLILAGYRCYGISCIDDNVKSYRSRRDGLWKNLDIRATQLIPRLISTIFNQLSRSFCLTLMMEFDSEKQELMVLLSEQDK